MGYSLLLSPEELDLSFSGDVGFFVKYVINQGTQCCLNTGSNISATEMLSVAAVPL